MKFSIVMTLSIFLMLCSCSEDSIVPEKVEFSYFPNNLNSSWKYERIDSLRRVTDTLIVKIVGDTILSGVSMKIWQYKSDIINELKFVQETGDSILIYDSREVTTVDQSYITPFNKEDVWRNPSFSHDSSYVVSIQEVEIQGQNYTDVAMIERNFIILNDILVNRIWFKPGVGIIKLEMFQTGLSLDYRNESWHLIEANLK